MKTYEEACEIFLQKLSDGSELTQEKIDQANEGIAFNHSRYREIILDIQMSEKTKIISIMLVQSALGMGLTAEGLAMLAISHGAAIGIEMERQDAPATEF